MFQTITNIFQKNTISKIFSQKGISVISKPEEILKHDHAELRKKCKVAYQRSTLKLYEMLLRADKTKIHNSYVNVVHANGKYCDKNIPTDIMIGCIDERCQSSKQINISLAGCGALLDNDELYTRCEDILKECNEAGVESIGVCGHAGCGAAALAVKTGLFQGKRSEERRVGKEC